MNAATIAKLNNSLKDIARDDHGFDAEGLRFEVVYYADVGRYTTRSLIFVDGLQVGFVDYVVPWNIFRSPYEEYYMNFAASSPEEIEEVRWQEDPYWEESSGRPMLWAPFTGNIEVFAKFVKERVLPSLKAKPKKADE